jgi:hypothetical protein
MRLKNTTSFPDDRVREIIQFVKPSGLRTRNFDVVIRNTRHGFGGKFVGSREDDSSTTKTKAAYIIYPSRPKILANIQRDEKRLPVLLDNTKKVSRKVKLYYQRYNEKTREWDDWYSYRYVAISKAYIKRRTKENGRPYDPNKGNGGYIPHIILSREEGLIHILAHELRHFWQANHTGKRGKIWGAKGHFSETDADAYAIRKTREWRKLHAVEVYPEHPDTENDS